MNTTYSSGGKNIPTSIELPTGPANGGLVILAYGSDGLVDNANGQWKTMIEDCARQLASAGFVAAIPEYFERTGTRAGDLDPTDVARYTVQVLGNQDAWAQTLGDAVTELPKLAALSGINPARIGFIGYSLGGYLCARTAQSVSALSLYSSPFLMGLGSTSPLSTRVEIHHGSEDFLSYTANAVLLQKALTARGAACQLWPEYPGATHGFDSSDPADAAANALARSTSLARTLAFF